MVSSGASVQRCLDGRWVLCPSKGRGADGHVLPGDRVGGGQAHISASWETGYPSVSSLTVLFTCSCGQVPSRLVAEGGRHLMGQVWLTDSRSVRAVGGL